jgi:hypothetical protein
LKYIDPKLDANFDAQLNLNSETSFI